LSKQYRDLTPDEAVALVDSGAHIEVGWLEPHPPKHGAVHTQVNWEGYDNEFDWCPDLAKHLKYRVEVE